MNYRYMRLILFFDLPIETSEMRRDYRHFVKDIQKIGFYRLQKSVYIKLNIDQRSALASLNEVKKIKPKNGNIAILMITEKQFNDIEFILGENFSEVIDSDERYIEL